MKLIEKIIVIILIPYMFISSIILHTDLINVNPIVEILIICSLIIIVIIAQFKVKNYDIKWKVKP